MSRKKRVVVIADLHCGNKVGLVHPAWRPPAETYVFPGEDDLLRTQAALWQHYADSIDALRPIDALIVNADCIDGRGERSGGTELITTDIDKQCDMAVDAINYAGAPMIGMTYGTPYHTGTLVDHETRIAEKVGAQSIGGHEWFTVAGVTFDCKHKIGSSTIPHGRFTALAREKLWAGLWEARDVNPKSQVIVRSHVHYFVYCGGPDWLGVITPALQGQGTKYGVRQCSGTVDFGLLWFDCQDGRLVDWGAKIAPAEMQKAEATVL